jgi:oligoendopeptidase F
MKTPYQLLFYPGKETHRDQLKERSEIDDTFKWNTGDVYTSDKQWETDFNNLQQNLGQLGGYRNEISQSAFSLLECLRTRDEQNTLLGKLFLYASLKSDEDTRISKYQAYREQITALSVQLNEKQSYIEPEILTITPETLDRFLEEAPDLKLYHHYLEDLLRTKNHVLTGEGEQLLALAGDLSSSPYQIFSMFNNADIKFPKIKNTEGKEIELTKGNFSVLMKSPKRDIRQKSFRALYQTYEKWSNTLSASLAAAVKRDTFFARSRRYNSAIQAALDTYNIPVTVYENVVNTVNDNLDSLHQYNHLRAKILKVKRVKPWDLYVPLVKELEWKISYQDALEILSEAMQPLGDDYLKEMNKGFSSGWFDVYENTGKRSGAYSTAVYGVPHPYMLLNYQGLLDDLFTVAHEVGHSMHSLFSIRSQPYIYHDYTIFVAEVASTLNEALLLDYLLKHTTDNQRKAYLLNQYIEQIKGTLFIQTIFAEFEKIIHQQYEKGNALTAEFFSETTSQLYTRYYGESFEMDPLYRLNWSRIPHFYYNFYVYQYATGISAATMLSRRIIEGDEQAKTAYLRFLSKGTSDYSINLLQEAGVDMTTSQPILETIQVFQKSVDQLDRLLTEMNK